MSTHVRIHPRCGACGYAFEVRDPLIALRLEESGLGAYPAEKFNFGIHPEQGDDERYLFCHSRDCEDCSSGAESATVHSTCYKLLSADQDWPELQRALFAVAISRYPWRDAMVARTPTVPDPDAVLEAAASLCALPTLRALPREVALIIWQYLPTSTFCRFWAVMQLLDTLKRYKSHQTTTLYITEIRTWHRGQTIPELAVGSDTKGKFTRLVIDALGVKSIEQLDRRPRGGDSTDVALFVVEPIEALRDILFVQQYGFGRLNLPFSLRRLPLWDTPTPPSPEELAHTISDPVYLRTIDLAKCTGLTFFMSGSFTLDIHEHKPGRASAYSTFRRLKRFSQHYILWVYVPLSKMDELVAFGLCWTQPSTYAGSAMNFWFRKTLTGDNLVGVTWCDKVEHLSIRAGSASSLLFNFAPEDGVTDISAQHGTVEYIEVEHSHPVHPVHLEGLKRRH